MSYLRLYTTSTGWSIFLDYEWDGVSEARRKPWEEPRHCVIDGLFVEGPKVFVPATYGFLGYSAHMRTVGPYDITRSNTLPAQCPATEEDRALLAKAADAIRVRYSNDPETKTPPWDRCRRAIKSERCTPWTDISQLLRIEAIRKASGKCTRMSQS